MTTLTRITDPTDLQWHALLERLPVDLDTTAFQYGALLRKRGVTSAALLLRLILAYACNLPLLAVVAWAQARNLVTLSDQALDDRIRQADAWLAHLLAETLTQRAALPPRLPLRVRLADTSLVQRPGRTQPDWRSHLTLDLEHQRLDAVTLTDHTCGDHLALAEPGPGELLLGDRGFCTRANVWAVEQTGAWVLIRVALEHLPLQQPNGEALALLDACRTLAPGETREWAATTVAQGAIPAVPGRLVITRLPEDKAAAARERVTKARRKYGKQKGQLTPEALEMAGYVVLWTTVPAALVTTAQVAALYRLRWQIELAIKRYKSLCGLAQLTARHTALCRATLLAKLLLCVLAEDLAATAEGFFP